MMISGGPKMAAPCTISIKSSILRQIAEATLPRKICSGDIGVDISRCMVLLRISSAIAAAELAAMDNRARR